MEELGNHGGTNQLLCVFFVLGRSSRWWRRQRARTAAKLRLREARSSVLVFFRQVCVSPLLVVFDVILCRFLVLFCGQKAPCLSVDSLGGEVRGPGATASGFAQNAWERMWPRSGCT